MTYEQALERVSGMLGDKRLRHTEGVSRAARELARRFGEDEDKAALAGALHDICKELPKPEQLQWALKSGIILSAEDRLSPQLWHAMAGAQYIREELGVDDEDLIAAVRWHTTGRAGMSRLEMIAYLADYISEERDFPGVDELRALAREASLEEAVLMALGVTIKKLLRTGTLICLDTVRAYNWLTIKIRENEKEAQGRT